MEQEIVSALVLLRASPESGDEAVFAELLTRGIERRHAARVIEFLPMAYTRVLFGAVSPRFPASFRRRLADGTTQEFPLTSEPIWDAVMAHALSEVRRGVPRKDLLAIATRSAELDAINKLLNTGAKLQEIGLTPPILLWPETGPSHDAFPLRSELTRSTGQEISNAGVKRPATQPYLWGKFQAWLALPQAVALFVASYDLRGWPRYADWILCVVCLIVWRGLSHKRRYGLVLFYLLALEAYANAAWTIERNLARHQMDLFWLLQSSLFWWGMIWGTILYLIPCTLYYPKRWNEFR